MAHHRKREMAARLLLLVAVSSLRHCDAFRARRLSEVGPGELELWSVVLDAGSTGTRVAVYKFVAPEGLDNVTQVDLDFFEEDKVKPGLSFYAGQPDRAAASLEPLVKLAMAAIPAHKQASTPLMLGATAGLRFLPQAESEAILVAVRAYLRTTPFQFNDADVRIISGAEEGLFAWAQANYLLGRLGLPQHQTIGVIDMGGGSMQEAFAMSPEEAAAAPPSSKEVVLVNGTGTVPDYEVYSHSYLGFGSKAARSAVLAQGSLRSSPQSPCIPAGVNETWTYDGKDFPVLPLAEGPSASSCTAVVLSAIKTYESCGADSQDECTFQGTWGGRRTPAEAVLISSFWWTALEGGLISENATAAELSPRDYGLLADVACSIPLDQYPEAFPLLAEEGYPYLCLDATFMHTVLTRGFKFGEDLPLQVVSLVSHDRPSGTVTEAQEVEMSWTLGAALSSLLGWSGEVAGTSPAPSPAPDASSAALSYTPKLHWLVSIMLVWWFACAFFVAG